MQVGHVDVARLHSASPFAMHLTVVQMLRSAPCARTTAPGIISAYSAAAVAVMNHALLDRTILPISCAATVAELFSPGVTCAACLSFALPCLCLPANMDTADTRVLLK